MNCAICRARKGKRPCRLTSAQSVCPSCCASARRAECDGCGYYESSLSYHREKQIRGRNFIGRIIPELDDRCDEALELVEKGDMARGQEILEELWREYPDYHSVLFGVGVCYGQQGRTEESFHCFERAVEVFPLFSSAYCNLGTACLQKLDIASAVKAYQTAIEIDGDDGPVGRQARKCLDEIEAIVTKDGISLTTYISNHGTFDRAFAALRERRFQAAVGLFAQVLMTERNHVQSHGNIGLAYAGLGNKRKALEHLNKAIEIDPEYEPAIFNRLAVQNMKDGEAFHIIDRKEINYYRDFKLEGRSYVQALLAEAGAQGPMGPGAGGV